MICAGVYVMCATFYAIFSSGQRQKWDNPDKDDEKNEKREMERITVVSETQH